VTAADRTPLAIARNIYAAFERGDLPGLFALLAPDMEWNEAAGHPYGGRYVGQEAIVAGIFMRLGAEWQDFAATIDEYVAQGDKVVVLGTYSGTCKATGKSVEVPFAHVWTVRDGKVVSLHQHTDTALFWNAMR
jgi:hypothetical protein